MLIDENREMVYLNRPLIEVMVSYNDKRYGFKLVVEHDGMLFHDSTPKQLNGLVVELLDRIRVDAGHDNAGNISHIYEV